MDLIFFVDFSLSFVFCFTFGLQHVMDTKALNAVGLVSKLQLFFNGSSYCFLIMQYSECFK